MWSKPRIPALAAVAMALLMAGGAAAGPLVGSALRAAVSGGVFRGFTNTLRGFENHVWRFHADGQVTAAYNIRKDTNRRGFQYDGTTFGTWSIQGDLLCIQWEPSYFTQSGCYRVVIDENVSVLDGHYVRLMGAEHWEGTLQR